MNMYNVELEEYSIYSVRNNSPKSLKSITTIPYTPHFEVEYQLKEWSCWNSGDKFQ